jgi:putative methyltransferase|tara:strand:+ start:315 stop:2180 length:1866 start_codon:yes stop_codon:yes gene_type:complete
MYKVSLINPNFQTGPEHLNSYYLPYTIGALWGYLSSDERIAKNFEINNWVFKRADIAETVEQCKGADVALMSLYIWNKNYCYKLAQELKKANPDIIIIAGGPEIEWRDRDYHTKHPEIDSICINEGEQAIKHVFNCILDNNEIPQRNHFERLTDLNIESPYLLGLFDHFITDFPDIEWVPTLETDRGCPYQCTFCDWGSATASQMYKFNMERIQADINWFADNGLPYVSMTNSNFGIYKERDLDIAEMLCETNRRTGHPSGLSVSFAKNSNSTVVEIVKKLTSHNIQSGLYISLQSTSTKVLENIKRKNLKINKIGDLNALAKENSMPLLTDLILGMPGETPQSWIKNIENVFKNDITNMDVYYLQLLVNAPMNVDQKEEFTLETFGAYDYFYETNVETIQKEIEAGVAESIQVIKSSNTMNHDELLDASIFSWFVLGTHCLGLSHLLAHYLHNTNGIKYTDFYLGLMEYLKKNDADFSNWIAEYKHAHATWYELGYTTDTIGGIKSIGWQVIFSLMPILQKNNKVNLYIDHVSKFAKEKYKVNDNLLHDYCNITQTYIKQFGKYLHSPIDYTLTSDLLDAPSITIEDRYNHFPETAELHLDYIFYGRRRSWAMNRIRKHV